jgi:cytochrome P450
MPILGRALDTLDFLFISGWKEFFAKRQRKYGSNVFKANLFQPTIVVLDHPAISRLFKSEYLIQDYGFSWAVPPLPMVGNVPPSIFGAGDAHDLPKTLYMRLLQKRSSTLLPVFSEVSEEFITRWASLREFRWADELEDFAVSFLFQWMLGERPDPKDVRELYNNIFLHVFSAVTKHIPWSQYCRSVAIYERLLAFVKRSRNFPEIAALAGEVGLTDKDAVAKQITFLLGMNSFLGTQNFLKSIVGELGSRPGLCDRLRAEMKAALGTSKTLNDVKALAAMPTLDKTLREILRLHPPVFFIFGRATRDLVMESKTGTFPVAKGELVMGVIPFAHRDASSFAEPDRFDPDRFDDPAASLHLIWPRGLHDADVSPQDRTCPGKDVAIIIGKLFSLALLLQVDWKLKDAKPEWEQRWFSLNVAAPKGPIEVANFRRR